MTVFALLIVLIVGVFDVAFLWVCGGGARALAVVLAIMVLAGLWAFGAIVVSGLLAGLTAVAVWEADR